MCQTSSSNPVPDVSVFEDIKCPKLLFLTADRLSYITGVVGRCACTPAES